MLSETGKTVRTLDRDTASDPKLLRHYEGLIFKTASRYVTYVEEDFEDIQQVLRIKVWRALLSYDPSKSSMTRDRYVFSCVVNQCKDLVKRKRRNFLFIEEIAPKEGEQASRDQFEMHYLSTTHDHEYGGVEDDDLVVPSTLTFFEQRVITFMYLHFNQGEIAEELHCPKRDVEKAVKAIREKLADWKPSNEDSKVVPITQAMSQRGDDMATRAA